MKTLSHRKQQKSEPNHRQPDCAS